MSEFEITNQVRFKETALADSPFAPVFSQLGKATYS